MGDNRLALLSRRVFAMSPALVEPSSRYSPAAMALHWLIAVLLAAQIGVGWYMGDLPDHSAAQRNLEGLHISVGLSILLLTAVRIAIAIFMRPSALPSEMRGWERRLASVVQIAFYGLLVALPLSGWAMESFGPRPILFWGLTWPHLPGVGALAASADRRQMHEAVELAHTSVLVWTTIVLIGLHVLGALKHQFDGFPILWRMVPGLKRP